jgi:hypothetical protein
MCKIGNAWKPYYTALKPVHAISDVIAVSCGKTVHVFVVNFENRVHYLSWTSAAESTPQNAAWVSLGGSLLSNVAAAALGIGRLLVFACHVNNVVLAFPTKISNLTTTFFVP